MDLFRPFLGQFLKLSTFSAVDSSPEAVFLASLGQLKHLIVSFRTNYPDCLHYIQWHHVSSIRNETSLATRQILMYSLHKKANLYVANAVLRAPHIADWRFYFMLALQCYFDLAAYYPFTRAVLSGLLSMVTERGLMRLQDACIIYNLAVASGEHAQTPSGVLVVDQDRALKDVYASRVEKLTEDLTSRFVFEEFIHTDVFGEQRRSSSDRVS